MIVGIDFGTSNSCICVCKDDQRTVIPNLDGNNITPSYVSIQPSGKIEIGQKAKNSALLNPLSSIFNLKLFLGKDFENIEQVAREYPFLIKKDETGKIVISIHGKTYSVEELISFLLKYLKLSAEHYLGEEVTEAIYTIPIDFRKNEIDALKEASYIAGITPRRMIRESTAACLAYGITSAQEGVVLIFDLGGGSLDVSIIDTGEDVYEVFSTSGSLSLGGRNFDMLITNYLIEYFIRTEGVDFRNDPIVMARLMIESENAKIKLTEEDSVEIELPFISINGRIKNIKAEIKKSHYRELSRELIYKCMSYIEIAIDEATYYFYRGKAKGRRVRKEEITKVVLVGAGTKMPFIKDVLCQYFGMEISHTERPEFSVVEGAAIQGGVISGVIQNVLLLDTTAHSLGFQVFDDLQIVVDKYTTIPSKKAREYEANVKGSFNLKVMEFYSENNLTNNRILGTIDVRPVDDNVDETYTFKVTFSVDVSGDLTVSISNLGREVIIPESIKVQDVKRFSATDLEGITQRVVGFEKASRKEYQEFKLMKLAEQVLTHSKQQFHDYEKYIVDEHKESIGLLMQRLENLLFIENYAALSPVIDELNKKWQVISQVLYLSQDRIEKDKVAEDRDRIRDVEQQLIEGDLNAALDGLMGNSFFQSDDEFKNEIVMQSFIYQSNEKNRRLKIISLDDYHLVRSQVSYAILNYVDLVKKSIHFNN